MNSSRSRKLKFENSNPRVSSYGSAQQEWLVFPWYKRHEKQRLTYVLKTALISWSLFILPFHLTRPRWKDNRNKTLGVNQLLSGIHHAFRLSEISWTRFEREFGLQNYLQRLNHSQAKRLYFSSTSSQVQGIETNYSRPNLKSHRGFADPSCSYTSLLLLRSGARGMRASPNTLWKTVLT